MAQSSVPVPLKRQRSTYFDDDSQLPEPEQSQEQMVVADYQHKFTVGSSEHHNVVESRPMKRCTSNSAPVAQTSKGYGPSAVKVWPPTALLMLECNNELLPNS